MNRFKPGDFVVPNFEHAGCYEFNNDNIVETFIGKALHVPTLIIGEAKAQDLAKDQIELMWALNGNTITLIQTASWDLC